MSCLNCGSPFHEKWACTKPPKESTAARKDVRSQYGIEAPALRAGTKDPIGQPVKVQEAGTQAPPVDTPRLGRPRTITDMKAYRAQKARERRAKKASIPS